MTAHQVNLESYLPQFGIDAFRPGQEEVISTVLAGEDCLCVMPTGGGKSLCYQLPAIVLDGLTLVVSPLIALMKDQVDQLLALGLPVTYINSTLTPDEISNRFEGIVRGEYRLVYVVPERFRSPRFLEAVRSVGVKLLAIDEAHCISEWGHDFRPDYARLGHFRHLLDSPPTIALTATATDAVRHDILEQLSLSDAKTFMHGFARDNLFYQVRKTQGEAQRARFLLEFLAEVPGSGIVYASSRKRTEEVAARITQETGRRAIAYHAGLAPDSRHRAQEAFMQGRAEIVVATTAFGMGIDKSNVRFVVHYNLPGTIEGYYQEAGRAGRDGQPSRCLLLYNASDRHILEFFIESGNPSRETVACVYEFLRGQKHDPIELTQQEIKVQAGLSVGADGIGTCEQLLESAGVLERLIASENRAIIRIDTDETNLIDLLPKQARVQRRVLQALENLVGSRRHEMLFFQPQQLEARTEMKPAQLRQSLKELNKLAVLTYVPPFRGRAIRMIDKATPFRQLDIDFEAAEQLKKAEYEKLNQMVGFALSNRCRQATILHYFGEENPEPCGHCDNCGPVDGNAPDDRVPLDEAAITIVRKALSGVARAQARLRCGKTLVAQMLSGSKSAKLKQLGFDQLSTFGLLGHMQQNRVVDLLSALIDAEYIDMETLEDMDFARPVIRLSESGEATMRGEVPEVSLPLSPELAAALGVAPSPAKRKGAAETEEWTPPPMADADLLHRLKQWRNELARSTGVPGYVVLSNATLQEIACHQPDTHEALLAIKGIGEQKLKRYGDAILEQLKPPSMDADPVAEEPSEETVASPEIPETPHDASLESPTSADPARPTHYWTWRLLKAGFRPDECGLIRGLDVDEVLGHAIQAASEGCDLDLRWCLTEETIDLLQGLAANGEAVQLPSGISPMEWDLFVQCRKSSR